ncbi:MAG: MMPL family transporter [Bacteroidetes bacterium]|nr:MMPL family transporter [Bacteroidota bacterium]
MKPERYSLIALIAVALLTVFFAWGIRGITFDHNLEKFFPHNDPETLFFEQFRKDFENDNDFILIGLVNQSGIFDQEFLTSVDSLSSLLKDIPEIEEVFSPTNAKEYVRFSLDAQLTEIPFLHLNQPEFYSQDSISIFESPHLVDFLFSRDRKSVLIYVKHQPNLEENGCRNLCNQVDTLVYSFGFDEIHLAGKCYGQTFFVDLLHRELIIFIFSSVLLIILILWLFYRSVWGVLLPVSVVALATVWTVGTMSWLHIPLDMISNIIPTILMIIGVSDVIHLFTHYLNQKNQQKDKISALQTAIREVGYATLITSLTTAIGFLSLATSSFSSLVEMGLFSSLGLVYAFLLTYSIVPAMIILVPSVSKTLQTNPHNWRDKLDFLFRQIKKHQKTVGIISLGILITGIWGITHMRVNSYMLADLKDNHPLKKDFAFFAQHFGGTRPFDLTVEVTADSLSLFSPEILRQIEKIDHFLLEEFGVKNLISPSIIIKQANQIYHGGQEKYYRLPQSSGLNRRLERQIEKQLTEINLDRYLTQNHQKGRISGKNPDWGTSIAIQKEKELWAFIQTNNLDKELKFHMTGTAYLMDLNNIYIVQNVITGLIIATLIIGILFGAWFKSFKMVFITLIPNLLPLLFVAGFMGMTGIDLRISTAIIFIISFGIAVDDSIHFLSRFKHELIYHPVEIAVRNAYLTTGKAITITSVILAMGFLTLCLSDFLGTFYIGLLIAITLLIALVADLALLPVLLERFYIKKEG